jgi:hypothetical protein
MCCMFCAPLSVTTTGAAVDNGVNLRESNTRPFVSSLQS